MKIENKELYDTLSDADCKILGELSSDLSPENLSCDGECSNAQVHKRLKVLMKQWTDIEAKVGFLIDVEDYEWYHYNCRDDDTGAKK